MADEKTKPIIEKADKQELAGELNECLDDMTLKGKKINDKQKMKIVLAVYSELRKKLAPKE